MRSSSGSANESDDARSSDAIREDGIEIDCQWGVQETPIKVMTDSEIAFANAHFRAICSILDLKPAGVPSMKLITEVHLSLSLSRAHCHSLALSLLVSG